MVEFIRSPFDPSSLNEAKFDEIDAQITAEVNSVGAAKKIRNEVRRRIGRSPTMAASICLVESIATEGRVLIATGYPVPYPFSQKREVHSDGPVGVGSLAKSILAVSDVKCSILTDEGLARIQERINDGLEIRKDVRVQEFLKNEDPDAQAKRILDGLEPSIIISSEKMAMNSDGVYHTALGDNLSEYVTRVDSVFHEANRRRIPTLGIGDFGNEIGMGLIHDFLPKHSPERRAMQMQLSGRDCLEYFYGLRGNGYDVGLGRLRPYRLARTHCRKAGNLA